mgnify:CR=1 FL=1|jgi:hypothetical protein
MITKITKMVPKRYYIIDGVEFPASDLFHVLETIVEGDSEDLDYYFYSIAEELVNLGYLIERFGYHEGVVYYDTENKKAAALFEEILKM